jgi:hypothetical protein
MRAAALLCIPLALAVAAAQPRAQTFNGRTAREWVQDLGADDQATRDRAVLSLVSAAGVIAPSRRRRGKLPAVP